jgi:glutathione S-transferase
MKLYLNKTSPYARLVMVVAHEKALTERIELAWTDPWANPPELLNVNAFSKVPVLVTDDGQPIIESVCICDYLDQIGGAPRLLPTEAAERLPVLRKYGLGRGLIDTAFGVTIERRFSGTDSTLAVRWLGAVRRAIDALEHDRTLLRSNESPDLGDLALAVGLSYVEFRLPELNWRSASPRLSQWLDRLSARPSMRLSAPE